MTKHKHCIKCGARLVVTRSDKMGYDLHTGEPIFVNLYECPNKKWYSFFHTTWTDTKTLKKE